MVVGAIKMRGGKKSAPKKVGVKINWKSAPSADKLL
jgi:hypothetical protein